MLHNISWDADIIGQCDMQCWLRHLYLWPRLYVISANMLISSANMLHHFGWDTYIMAQCDMTYQLRCSYCWPMWANTIGQYITQYQLRHPYLWPRLYVILANTPWTSMGQCEAYVPWATGVYHWPTPSSFLATLITSLLAKAYSMILGWD